MFYSTVSINQLSSELRTVHICMAPAVRVRYKEPLGRNLPFCASLGRSILGRNFAEVSLVEEWRRQDKLNMVMVAESRLAWKMSHTVNAGWEGCFGQLGGRKVMRYLYFMLTKFFFLVIMLASTCLKTLVKSYYIRFTLMEKKVLTA